MWGGLGNGIGHWGWGLGICKLTCKLQRSEETTVDCGLWIFIKLPYIQCQSAIVNKWTKLQLFPIVISVKGKSKYDIIIQVVTKHQNIVRKVTRLPWYYSI